MKKILIASMLIATPAVAQPTSEQYAACESAYRAKNKADNAAAPEGYKVARPKGFKANFMITCLSK